MKYRKVDPRIWNDAKFRGLSDDGQLAFFLLLTHPHTTAVGALRSSIPGLAAEKGWDEKRFRKAFAEAFGKGMVKADERASLIWLPNFLKYNKPENPNVCKAWVAGLADLPECPLFFQLLQGVKAFIKGLPEAFQEAFAEAFGKGMPILEPEPEPDLEPDLEPEPEPLNPLAPLGEQRDKKETQPHQGEIVTTRASKSSAASPNKPPLEVRQRVYQTWQDATGRHTGADSWETGGINDKHICRRLAKFTEDDLCTAIQAQCQNSFWHDKTFGGLMKEANITAGLAKASKVASPFSDHNTQVARRVIEMFDRMEERG